MKHLTAIGELNPGIEYIDRPTVKVLIHRDDQILLFQNGLLPGGGIESGESHAEAVNRELVEELGMAVDMLEEIGEVTQYRNFLGKRYQVYGYRANFVASVGAPTTTDERELNMVYKWMPQHDALALVDAFIAEQQLLTAADDSSQGWLYNLMTVRELIAQVSEL